MHNAADLAKASLRQPPASTASTTSANVTNRDDSQAGDFTPPTEWLRRLWERMIALYGHAWTSLHGLSPQGEDGKLTVAGDTWRVALAGMRAQQLGRGIEACVAEGAEFAPSAPRFRAMCLGIPTFGRVQLELREPATCSPFAYAVWQFVDTHQHRHASAKEAERMLHAAYDTARDLAMRGEPLPTRPEFALGAPENREFIPASEQTVQRAFHEIRELLGTPAVDLTTPYTDEELARVNAASRGEDHAG